MNKVIILGTSGNAVAALEIFQSNGIEVYGFLSHNKDKDTKLINGIPILGHVENEQYLSLIKNDCGFFVASDSNIHLKNHIDYLKKLIDVNPINAIHASTCIASSATMGHGNFVDALALFSANVRLANHCMIGASVSMGQKTTINNFVQIGQGTTIDSGVIIEEEVFVGVGATIISGVTLGKNARIGAGSVVINSIEPNQTVFGNPAVPAKTNDYLTDKS